MCKWLKARNTELVGANYIEKDTLLDVGMLFN